MTGFDAILTAMLTAHLPVSAEAERRWNLDWIEGEQLLMVRPKVLHRIAIHAGQYYDTTLARLDGQSIVATETEGWSTTPPVLTPTTFFCGLSSEDYRAVCADQQMPKDAVLVDDPLRAVPAQWTQAPTFDQPAIVVRVTRPMPTRGGGLTAVITDVHVGRPYRISAGQIRMQRIDNHWTEGTRQSPTSWLVWKRVDPGTPIEAEAHVYRLGWCVTCNTLRIDCRGNANSGNHGHKGVPGQRGGSAPSDGGSSSAPSELSSAGDALHSLLNGEKVNIVKEEVRDFVEKARDQNEDPDLTDVHVEGMLIFGGNGLGIARADMPQIPTEHRERFLEEAEAQGIKVKTEHVSPLALAPTQKEISARLVGEKLDKYENDPDREFPPLLVAQDKHVLDGHHHWGAMATVAIDNPDVKVPIHRLMTTTKKALELMHAYDKKHGIVRKTLSNTPTKDKRRKIAASTTYAMGGQGSGNFGHTGRPGEIGGSGEGGSGESGSKGDAVLSEKGTGEHLTVPASASPDFGSDRPTPRQVDNVPDAVAAILKGEVVEIQDVRHVHTVLSKLAAMATEAKEKGEKAPKYDLCKVSVAGSNLFCGSPLKTKEFPNGVPRINMPQLKGPPVPGSKADKLTKSASGSVNVADQFVEHLKSLGIETSKATSVPANSLKATQAQMEGQTVARMMTDPTYNPAKEPIFISRDNYVLDGHHRWAAQVGRDAEDGKLGDSHMNVIRVDAPISELFHRANQFTKDIGISERGMALRAYAAKVYALAGWEEGEHPRDSSGKFDESTGGGADTGSASGGSTKGATAKAGWTPVPKKVPGGSTTSKKATGTSSAPPRTSASAPGKPVGPTTTADATGGPGRPPASMTKVMDKMLPAERQALDVGYKDAQIQAGFTGSIDDFFAEQVALYQHAPEGDPRLKTWFSAETLAAVASDPDAKSYTDFMVAKQTGQADASKQSIATREAIAKSNVAAGGKAGASSPGSGEVTPDTGSPNIWLEPEGGGGGGGGKKEGDLKAEQALLATLKPGTPEYLAQKKKVDALVAAGKKGGGKGGTATGKGGESGAVKANATKVMGAMQGDESQALNKGYATAQAAGYSGTIEDYFVQQVALYQYAPEGDPRIGTYFYGDTLSKAQADPTLWAQVQAVIAQQKSPTATTKKGTAAKTVPVSTVPIPTLPFNPAQFFWDHVKAIALGGAGSGNFGHEGRPGEVGGSGGDGGSSAGGSARTDDRMTTTAKANSVIAKAAGGKPPMQPNLPEPQLSADHLAKARTVLEPEAKDPKNRVPTDEVLDAMDANAREQFAALVKLGHESQPAMKRLTEGIAAKIGAKLLGPTDKNSDGPEPEAQQGDVKSLDRAVKKALGKDNGDARNVRDVVRNSIAVDTVEDLDRAIVAVTETMKEQGVEIATADNRFAKPLPSGYRDMQLTVRLPNGAIGEVQVHVKPMLAAKNGKGHVLFERQRTIIEQGLNRPGGNTPEELAEIDSLNTQSRELYEAAWAKAGGK